MSIRINKIYCLFTKIFYNKNLSFVTLVERGTNMQHPYRHIKMKTNAVLVHIDVTYAVECIVIHQVFIPTKNLNAARILNTPALGVLISLGKKAILHIISPECI